MAQRVFFVDDEQETLRLVSILLKREGFEIMTAGTGKEAIAQSSKMQPDIIILDIVMPDQDGYDTAKTIRENEATANIPILIFTGKPVNSAKKAAMAQYYDDFITKPVHPTELVTRIKSLIAKARKSRRKPGSNSTVGFLSVDNGHSASVIALNAAIALYRLYNAPITLLELKPGNGSLHIDLGLNNFTPIEHVLGLKSFELTPTVLQDMQVQSAYGVNLLLSRSSLGHQGGHDGAMNYAGLINSTQKLTPISLIDYSMELCDRNSELLTAASDVYICVKPNPMVVHKSRQLLDFLTSDEKLRSRNYHVILYNHGWNEGLFPQHKIQEQLNAKVTCTVPASPNLTLQSSLTHTPISVAYPNSEIAQAYGKIANHIREQLY